MSSKAATWTASSARPWSGSSNGASAGGTYLLGYRHGCIKGTVTYLDEGWVCPSGTAVVAYYYNDHQTGSGTSPQGTSFTIDNDNSVGPYYLVLAEPPAPQAVQLPSPSILLTATDTTKIQVKMSSVANASSYTLQYSTNSSFSSSSSKTISPGTTTITGLTPNTTYYFRVKANTTSSSYIASDYCTAESCATLKTALPTPLVVTASAQDATTIKIEYQTTPF